AVGDLGGPRCVGADVVPGHNVVGRTGAVEGDAVLSVARDDIPFGCVRHAIAIGSDARLGRALPDQDASEGVGYCPRAGRVGTDVIASDNGTGRPNALDLDSLLEIARNDVSFGRIVRAITVRSDAGVSGTGPDHDATVAGVDRYGGGAGGVQTNEVTGDMRVIGARAVNQNASAQVAGNDITRARGSAADDAVLSTHVDYDAIGGIAEG